MKRSGFKNPGKGLSRKTPLRTKTPIKASKPMERSNKPIKKRAPKSTPIRQSARGEECTMRIPGVCRNERDTVVWCHENSFAAGKGMGLKARDECGAYGCSACHAVYDGQAPRPPGLTKEDIDVYFARGKHVSRQILQRKGLLANNGE